MPFFLAHPAVSCMLSRQLSQNTGGIQEKAHTHTHTDANSQIHTPTSAHTHAWRGNDYSCFLSPEHLPSLRRASWASARAAEPEDRCLSAEAEQWYDMWPPCHLKQGHTERQLPPDAGAGAPAACRVGAWDPVRRANAVCLWSHTTHIACSVEQDRNRRQTEARKP